MGIDPNLSSWCVPATPLAARNGDPARKRECGLYGENLILKIYFIVIYHLGVFAQRHSL
jgi:hypothetical protein